MEFFEAVKSVYFHKYCTFKGRASRSEFWWSFLFLYLILMLLGVSYLSLFALSLASLGGLSLLAVLLLIPHLAVTSRRFHDLNRSALNVVLYFVLFCIPLINLVAFVFFVVRMSSKGTCGDNEYGKDPCGGSANFKRARAEDILRFSDRNNEK